MRGSTTSGPHDRPTVAIATTSPTGLRAASTSAVSRIDRRWSRTRTPYAIRDQVDVVRKSTPNWATNAPAYSGALVQLGADGPATASTTAGPTEYQALAMSIGVRVNRFVRRTSWAATNAVATRSGTSRGGRAKNMGTRTSWLGAAKPSPTSNFTRVASAYATTAMTAAVGENARPAGRTTAAVVATARNDAASESASRSSTVPMRRRARFSLARFTRSAASGSPAATASMVRLSITSRLGTYLGRVKPPKIPTKGDRLP